MKRLFQIGRIFKQYSSSDKRHAMVGPAHLWKMKREFQIKFLREMGLEPHHYFLDMGCGSLRGGIPVIRYLQSGHYYGTEVRRDVIEEGVKELREAKLEYKKPSILSTDDITSEGLDRDFDLIWSFSVLMHMNDESLDNNFSFVCEHLKSSGRFFANVNIGDEKEASWQGFPVVWHSLDFYRELACRHGLVVSDIGTLLSLGHASHNSSQDQQRMLLFEKG